MTDLNTSRTYHYFTLYIILRPNICHPSPSGFYIRSENICHPPPSGFYIRSEICHLPPSGFYIWSEIYVTPLPLVSISGLKFMSPPPSGFYIRSEIPPLHHLSQKILKSHLHPPPRINAHLTRQTSLLRQYSGSRFLYLSLWV